jgi:hypothetical protein
MLMIVGAAPQLALCLFSVSSSFEFAPSMPVEPRISNVFQIRSPAICGVPTVHRRMFNIVIASSEAERKEWLSEVAATIDRIFPKACPE